jgi:hypothetical protein
MRSDATERGKCRGVQDMKRREKMCRLRDSCRLLRFKGLKGVRDECALQVKLDLLLPS